MDQLTAYDRRRVALEALASERTVQRAYRRPGSVRDSTLRRIVRAAERLGVQPPTAGTQGEMAG